MLARWEAERTFERLREQNRGGPRFSFIDGPITANNPMGVHHAWGRTLKDVFQRYKALRGFDQRYQNGFDCQGLWVEVEVEKSLGLNSKREIEEYGLAEFADRCRERVAEYAERDHRAGSSRLGRWMDWGADYYTFSDTNIEYIWRFLKVVHERGWLYQGHRSTQWCPRCGTSISQHEVYSGEYRELEHPSLYVRFPLTDRDGESLVVWTTTPWTLPANVAAAVQPDAEYGRTADGELVRRRAPAGRGVRRARARRGARRAPVPRPVRRPGGGGGGRAPRHPVGRGLARRKARASSTSRPARAPRTSSSAACTSLPVLVADRRVGRLLRHVRAARRALGRRGGASPIVASLASAGLLVEAGTDRAPLSHVLALQDAARSSASSTTGSSPPRRSGSRCSTRTRPSSGRRPSTRSAWTTGCATWATGTSRASGTSGCRCPFYPCACGHLTVIGSREELEQRALRGLDGLRELHRPWIDDVIIACDGVRGGGDARSPRSGDAWLDAGIVPLSTLGWDNEAGAVPGGYATGAAEGLTTADLPDHAYWEKWFPADWVSEMREQIRLWFYSISLHVGDAGRPLAVPRACSRTRSSCDETGREMHRSWGNAIAADEALDRMGADVMRWLFCEQVPSQNIRFGYGPGARDQAPAADALELREVLRRLRERLARSRRSRRPRAARPLAPRAHRAARRRGDRRVRALLDAGRRRVVRELRRRPVELVHPPLPAQVLERRRGRAARR